MLFLIEKPFFVRLKTNKQIDKYNIYTEYSFVQIGISFQKHFIHR
jgi:hypothetical protein